MLLHKVSIIAAHKIIIKCNYYLKLFNNDITNYHRPLLQWCLLVIVLASANAERLIMSDTSQFEIRRVEACE